MKENKPKKMLATINNFLEILENEGIKIKYNDLTKIPIINDPDFDLEFEEAFLVKLQELCYIKYNMRVSRKTIKDYLQYCYMKNKFNPINEFIKECKSLPNDDIYLEFAKFLNSIHFDNIDQKQIDFCLKILVQWMIGAYRISYNTLEKAMTLDIVPVIKGPQGCGKTTFIQNLIPSKYQNELINTGVTLKIGDKDFLMEILSYWIIELGEFMDSFDKSKIDEIKNFISKNYDNLRRPYCSHTKRYPRKNAFIATLNNDTYLKDDTGNRRFFTLPVLYIDRIDCLDMRKVWKVISILSDNHYLEHYVTKEEIQLNEIYNKDNRLKSENELILDSIFDWDSTEFGYVTTQEIRDYVYKNFKTNLSIKALAKILRFHNIDNTQKKINNVKYRFWKVPFVENLTRKIQ